jgi:hypothetical protein
VGWCVPSWCGAVCCQQLLRLTYPRNWAGKQAGGLIYPGWAGGLRLQNAGARLFSAHALSCAPVATQVSNLAVSALLPTQQGGMFAEHAVVHQSTVWLAPGWLARPGLAAELTLRLCTIPLTLSDKVGLQLLALVFNVKQAHNVVRQGFLVFEERYPDSFVGCSSRLAVSHRVCAVHLSNSLSVQIVRHLRSCDTHWSSHAFAICAKPQSCSLATTAKTAAC